MQVNVLHCCKATGELYVEHIPFAKQFSKSAYITVESVAEAASDDEHHATPNNDTRNDVIIGATGDGDDGGDTGATSTADQDDTEVAAVATEPARVPLHNTTNQPPGLKIRMFGIVHPVPRAAHKWLQENLVGRRATATMLYKTSIASAQNVVTCTVAARFAQGPWYTRVAQQDAGRFICEQGLAATMVQTLPTNGSKASRKMISEAAALGKIEESARRWGRGMWEGSAGRSAAAKALSAAGWLRTFFKRG